MFDFSFSELMVVGVVALVVIGPERLPKVAKTLGHLVGRAQRYVNDVKADIQREIELDDLRKFKEQVQEAAQSVKTSISDAQTAISEPLNAFEKSTMDTLHDVGHDAASTTNETATLATGEETSATVHVTDSASALAQVQAAAPETTSVVEANIPQQLEIDAVQGELPSIAPAVSPNKQGVSS